MHSHVGKGFSLNTEIGPKDLCVHVYRKKNNISSYNSILTRVAFSLLIMTYYHSNFFDLRVTAKEVPTMANKAPDK